MEVVEAGSFQGLILIFSLFPPTFYSRTSLDLDILASRTETHSSAHYKPPSQRSLVAAELSKPKQIRGHPWTQNGIRQSWVQIRGSSPVRLFKADTGRCGTEECILHPWECAAEVSAYPCVYVGGGYCEGRGRT